MSRDDGATRLLDLPDAGRTFSAERRVRLSDTTPDGLLRFDALARYVQDVASDDARETMTASYLAWVVRRAVLDVPTAPSSEETCTLTTWCAGYGPRWAERRTRLVGEDGGHCEAVVLWVAIDPETAAPARLPDTFHAAYDVAAAGRRVTARLQHDDPPDGASVRPWRFRAGDLDRLGHVNNAAYAVVVEELAAGGLERPTRLEIEYRAPIGPGETVSLVGDHASWWLTGEDGVRASFTLG